MPPGCLEYIGDYTYTTLLCGDYLNYIRIPIKQPVQWKVTGFFRGSLAKIPSDDPILFYIEEYPPGN